MIKQLISRWKAETPIFFKKVRALALKVGGASAAVTLYLSLHPEIQVAPVVVKVCSYIVVACVAMGGTAQLTQVATPTP